METNTIIQPHKKWQSTTNGFFVVPEQVLNVKTRHDENGHLPNIIRCTCPDCADYKEHGDDPCVRLNRSTGIGHCYKCGFTFVIDKHQKKYSKNQIAKQTEYKYPNASKVKVPDAVALDYLYKRSISYETARKAHVGSANHYFSKVKMQRDCIAFPYVEGNKVVNIQYKTTDKLFEVESGCELIPWNIDACLGQDSVFITEGMMDALALMEVGFENVISVANGAQTDMHTFDRFLETHLNPLTTIYLAGDMDEEGLGLRQRLAGYFGESRCKIVEWRFEDGEKLLESKDANEMLMRYGTDAVHFCIDNAHTCPISGVETIGSYRDKVLDIWEHGIEPGKTVGWGEFDDLVQWEPGRTAIVLGTPNTGKSTFADDLMLNLALQHGWKAAVYSPEMFPPERHIVRYATTIAGQQFRKETITTDRGVDSSMPAISQSMADHILNWLDNNIFFITEKSGRTIQALLRQAEQLQVRYGIKQLLLDPFNYIQLPDGAKSDTVKIGDILADIELFAHRTGIFVIVVVHPAKPQKGEEINSLYNASGSAEFRNRADYGLVLVNDDDHKRKSGRTDLHLLKVIVDKVRDDHMGHKGICHLSFDPSSYRHGTVQTIHQTALTDQLPILNILDISKNCWIYQPKDQDLPF